MFDTEEQEPSYDPESRAYDYDMKHALDEERGPSPDGSLLDKVNSEDFIQHFTDIKEEEISNLEDKFLFQI